MRGQADQFGIPARGGSVMPSHALTELDESVLDVAGMLFILEVFCDLPVGKAATEPGVPPEEERHEDDQPGGDENQGAIARGHFVVRGRRGLRGGVFLNKVRLVTVFRRGWRTGHVVSESNLLRRRAAAWEALPCPCQRGRGREAPRRR